ncbi:MAG TPA: N-acetylneuraminate synthase family protein [Solirubrobacterales bacterium]
MGRLRIVAEAAEGYAADWDKELALVELAARAGAGAIKFQLLHPDELLVPAHPLYGLVGDLQLPPERWRAVAERAGEMEVELLLDVFGRQGLELASELGVAAVKVHSSDMLNEALLREVAASPVPEVLVSAGGTSVEEVGRAVELLGGKQVTVVLGFQSYPTPVAENRLRRVSLLREALPGVALGFADHTGKDEDAATWLPALAIALGATYVEKHITVAHVLRDPDHESALAPDRFAQFVESMYLAEAALGEPAAADEMGEAEQAYRLKMKKHVVAARDLPAGTELGPDDLALKRVPDPPADVLFRLDEAEGATLAAPLSADAPLTRGDLSS